MLKGPIVDGWLESQADSQPANGSQPPPQMLTHSIDLATLRHAETDHLLKYIEELCSVKEPPVEQAEAGVSYRLCRTQRRWSTLVEVLSGATGSLC